MGSLVDEMGILVDIQVGSKVDHEAGVGRCNPIHRLLTGIHICKSSKNSLEYCDIYEHILHCCQCIH